MTDLSVFLMAMGAAGVTTGLIWCFTRESDPALSPYYFRLRMTPERRKQYLEWLEKNK